MWCVRGCSALGFRRFYSHSSDLLSLSSLDLTDSVLGRLEPHKSDILAIFGNVNSTREKLAAFGASLGLDTWCQHELASLISSRDLISFQKSSTSFVVLGNDTSAHKEELTLAQIHEKSKGDFLHFTSRNMLVKKIVAATNSLRGGLFVDGRGIASATFLGPKGTGKSYALQHLAQVVPLLVPNTAFGYVSFDKNAGLASPRDLIVAILRKVGHKVPYDVSLPRAFELLQTSNLCVVLFIDELDQLYRRGQDIPGAVAVLEQLIELASNVHGNTYTVVCGSSSSLPRLISCNSDDALQREFPVLKSCLSLNGSKYRYTRIGPGALNDEEFGRILRYFLARKKKDIDISDDDIRRLANVFRFHIGSNLRALQRVLAEDIDKDQFSSSEHWATRPARHRDRYDGLINELSKALLDKNSTLYSKVIRKDGTIDNKLVETLNWSTFKPLDRMEIMEVLKKVNNTTKSDLEEGDIHILCQSRYFDASEDLSELYPQSLVSCVVQARRTTSKQAGESFVRSIERVVPFLADVITIAGGVSKLF